MYTVVDYSSMELSWFLFVTLNILRIENLRVDGLLSDDNGISDKICVCEKKLLSSDGVMPLLAPINSPLFMTLIGPFLGMELSAD